MARVPWWVSRTSIRQIPSIVRVSSFHQQPARSKAGDRVGTVFFSNAERDIRAPLSGSVIEINRELESRPQLVKSDPYGSGWLFRLEVQAGEEIEHLLDSAAYRERLLAAEAMDIEFP